MSVCQNVAQRIHFLAGVVPNNFNIIIQVAVLPNVGAIIPIG